jgi:hypothetical protein
VKTLAIAVVVGSAGLALGLWATQATLSGALPIAVDEIGGWRLEARAGAADADPYTRARVERDGEIPLALGEGLRLTRRTDSDGRALDPGCVYKVGALAPPSRYWTLEAIDAAGLPLANAANRYVLRSSEILREPDGAFWIYVSAGAHAGNWLPVGTTRFGLALRLYDPALTGAAVGFEQAVAPHVVRVACG